MSVASDKSDAHGGRLALSLEQPFTPASPFTESLKRADCKYGGVGLGLSISRQVVTLMGKAMENTSEPISNVADF